MAAYATTRRRAGGPRRPAGGSRGCRCSAIRPTVMTASSAPDSTTKALSTCCRCRRATTVFDADTRFEVPPAKPGAGRPPSVPKADRKPTPRSRRSPRRCPPRRGGRSPIATTTARTIRSRFAFVRVIAARPVTEHRLAPREEWLIIERPDGAEEPSDYWLANLPADTGHERLARLARLRWMIELDYRQLKGELGLDHYEGRSYLGFHHHCAIVTAAHGFLTLER